MKVFPVFIALSIAASIGGAICWMRLKMPSLPAGLTQANVSAVNALEQIQLRRDREAFVLLLLGGDAGIDFPLLSGKRAAGHCQSKIGFGSSRGVASRTG